MKILSPPSFANLPGSTSGQSIGWRDTGATGSLSWVPNLPAIRSTPWIVDRGGNGDNAEPWNNTLSGAASDVLESCSSTYQGLTRLLIEGTLGRAARRLPSPGSIVFGTVGVHVYEAAFYISAVSNGTNTWVARFGFIDSATGDCTDGAYIEIDSNSNVNFQCKTSSGGVRTTTDSGLVAAASTWYFVRITVTNAASVKFEMGTDDGPVSTVATNSTNIPSGTGNSTNCGLHGIKTAGGNNRSIFYAYQLVGMDRFYK